MTIRGLLLVLAIGLCGCENMPEPYPPPAQRRPVEDYPLRLARMVEMNEPGAPSHFVKDILGGPAESWRWTNQRPTVKIRLRSNESIRYIIDFTIAEATLKRTGPVTISFFVNDHLLASKRYTAEGNQHFEKSVPPEWIKSGQDNQAAAEIDKVYVAERDGVRLGFILVRMGFTQ